MESLSPESLAAAGLNADSTFRDNEAIEYLEARITRIPESGCWIWNMRSSVRDYGVAHYKGKSPLAHRLSWTAYFGAIPAGLMVLHKCDIPSCINPDHLYIGTQVENHTDMLARDRDSQSKKTACPKGHEYTVENTYNSGGKRFCRACHLEHSRTYRNKRGCHDYN